MVTRRAANSPVGQSLPWFVAAVLVVVGSGLVALWMNNTATQADRDTLERGADAIVSNVEEQIRILELAGTGAGSLAGQPIEELDLMQLVTQIDMSVLTSLLAVVTYPVTEDGAGDGAFIQLDVQDSVESLGFEVPEIELTLGEFEDLQRTGEAFFSSPFITTDEERLDYVVAMPVQSGDDLQLVGVVFRPDRMLGTSVDAAGEGQYAVDLVDARLDDQLVMSIGEISMDMDTRRSPDGVKAALDLVVRPGAGFRSVQSPWISRSAVGMGILIALLLVWMGQMARARAAELSERLRLAQELNESKDRFLATVSHELRTPLTVVLGVASEVGPNWEQFDDADRQDLMTMMIEQASEAANIVEDLLVAARSDPSQLRLAMEHTSLLSHVNYALVSLSDESQGRVTCGDIDRSIYADSTRLRQILRNLLQNAVRYGGPDIRVDSSVVGDKIEVVISDNGADLAVSDMERIFEPYEQSRAARPESPTGVGIGLYVSRLLARLMNGNLDCRCEDGRTRFILTLPVGASSEVVVEKIGVAAS